MVGDSIKKYPGSFLPMVSEEKEKRRLPRRPEVFDSVSGKSTMRIFTS